MRLYDEEYFSELKVRLKKYDYSRLIRNLKYIAVSILFFFSWSNLALSSVGLELLLIPVGIILPFVLLILVVQYRNKIAFLTVAFIFQYSIFYEFQSLFSNLYEHLADDNGMGWAFRNPLQHIENALIFIPMGFLALLLLNSIFKRENVKIYRREYLLSIVGALGLLLLRPILYNAYFFVVNYIWN